MFNKSREKKKNKKRHKRSKSIEKKEKGGITSNLGEWNKLDGFIRKRAYGQTILIISQTK